MEKLIFTDGSTLDISAITNNGNHLVVSVHNGDFAALEAKFSEKENLAKVYLADEDGNKMAVFKNYAILKQLTKRKDVMIDEIEEIKVDIIDVTMEQEPEWVVSQRAQDARIGSVEETTDILTMNALG